MKHEEASDSDVPPPVPLFSLSLMPLLFAGGCVLSCGLVARAVETVLILRQEPGKDARKVPCCQILLLL